MKNVSKGTRVMIGLAAALLTGALSVTGARAEQGMTQRTGPGSAERTSSETMVVSGIDRANRTVTLTNAQGERETMSVPPDIRAYDTLKVGDHVDIDYREAIAVSLAPPGTKPSMSQRTAESRMAEGAGAGAAGRETTVNAKVVAVDVPNNKVTFKGPKGNTQVITVSDPTLQKKLPNLKPGQVVQFVYTEAVAAAIRPSAK